jgi:hypothetical protein
MARIAGKRGEIYIPVGKGNLITNAALSMSASKTIQGVARTNLFYGTSTRSAWNKGQTPTVRLQGVVGEVAITPGTAADTINVAAFSYHKDNAGVSTGTAATGVNITRHATIAVWNMVTVSNATGTVAVTAGTVTGSATAFNDVFDTDGGPAYIAAGLTLLGVVRANPGSATTTLTSEIHYTDVAGDTAMQERSDTPGFYILNTEGGVLMNATLLGCHTAGATRTAYASYYDQYPLLTKIGDIDAFTLNTSSDVIEMEAFGDFSPETDFAGAIKWSGTMSQFYLADRTLWANVNERRTAILRLWPDSNNTTIYYEGSVIFSDWSIDVSLNNAVKTPVSFTGDGPLEYRGAV